MRWWRIRGWFLRKTHVYVTFDDRPTDPRVTLTKLDTLNITLDEYRLRLVVESRGHDLFLSFREVA